MRYIPNYQLKIISEENFKNSINDIELEISRVKHEGKFTAFDGIEIYYEYFLVENSKGNVVIIHGLSEFTKKFYEFIYYTLNQGFNVFIYDQRCHGLSDRLTPIRDLLHVDSFEDYVKDMTYFIDEIVLKTEEKPIYLFAHSMGGAVSTFYLAKNKNKVKKAVFSVPMFEPVVKNVPFKIARVSVVIGSKIFGAKRKFFISKDFDPDVTFNYAYGLSKARFEHNMKMRRENVNYQSTPMSFGWVSNSLNIGKKILKHCISGKIETPILLMSAECDVMVNNEIQKEFSNKCKNCRFEKIEHATHAILASDEKILNNVLNLIYDFWN